MSADPYLLNKTYRNEFQSVVKRALPGRSDVRPFVCDGPPFSCEVFLVGFNPARNAWLNDCSIWQDDAVDRSVVIGPAKTDQPKSGRLN